MKLLRAYILVLLSVGWVFPVAAFTPDDTQLYNQDYLDRIQAFAAWDELTSEAREREVVIAVLDAGVDIEHPDLIDQIWTNQNEIPSDGIDNDGNSYIDDVHGWDFINSIADPRPKFDPGYVADALHHGTVVSGIIGARQDNGRGIAGLVPHAILMPLRVLDSEGIGNTLVLAQAIDYAVANGADVINLSLVGAVPDQRMFDAIERAYTSGVAVIAAAGNEEVTGLDLNEMPRYPVCDFSGVNRVLGVAAVDQHDRLAQFSNYGSTCIDIAAPGTHIFSSLTFSQTTPGFSEFYGGGWQGTSVAAPMVSATVANLKKMYPQLSLEKIYNLVIQSAKNISQQNEGRTSDLGAGLIDMGATLHAARELVDTTDRTYVYAPLKGKPLLFVVNESGEIVSSFFAYSPAFEGGVEVAVGDITGDGEDEIITVPHSDGGPHVRIFDIAGNLLGQFMAFDSSERGGYSIATADFDKDGKAEIVVSRLLGGLPEVRVYNYRGEVLSYFMAYSEQFRGGVFVGAADLDRDGRVEIVTSPASAGGPHVRIFSENGTLVSQFMAFDQSERGGYPFALADVNNDKYPEVIVVNNKSSRKEVREISLYGEIQNSWLAFSGLSSESYEIRLLTGDMTGDILADVGSYPATSKGDTLDIFEGGGRLIRREAINLVNNGGYSVQRIQ